MMPFTSKTAANKVARILMRAGKVVSMWREPSPRTGYLYYVTIH